MRADIKFIEEKFARFNREMFGSRLPLPPIELTDAGTFLGKCVYRGRLLDDGRREIYDLRLRFSTRFDIAERVAEDVVIHEMIHYFINYNGLMDTAPHGRIFRSLMECINRNYGRNVTISHKSGATAGEMQTEVADKLRRWHVIAVLLTGTGETGVKILPHVEQKIIDFRRRAMQVRQIKRVDLYLHDEPFFNQFPKSTALRIARIAPQLLREKLTGARSLRIENGHLIY